MSNPLKIFIIDDDPDFVTLLTTVFEMSGHTVLSDCAAVYALPRIRDEQPDCILTDLQMSEMDGLEFCKTIRENAATRHAVLIMISAHQNEMWRKKAKDAGADGYIVKPIDPQTITANVEAIVAGLS